MNWILVLIHGVRENPEKEKEKYVLHLVQESTIKLSNGVLQFEWIIEVLPQCSWAVEYMVY